MSGAAERPPPRDLDGERTALLRRPSLHRPPEDDGRPAESGFPNRDRDVSPTSTIDSRHDWDRGQWKKNVVLLLGVFLVNSDSAILLALFRQIASDFNSLSSASWIITAYLLGLISAQPLYGKLSDIYGRKPLLLISYGCYCLGSLLA